MKIISGKFKGSKLFLPQNKVTRPLKNIVKEAIFNLLNHSNKFSIKLEEKYILDLFSGTGSFGLECLSRKSKHVTFVENNVTFSKTKKRNCLRCYIDVWAGNIKPYRLGRVSDLQILIFTLIFMMLDEF